MAFASVISFPPVCPDATHATPPPSARRHHLHDIISLSIIAFTSPSRRHTPSPLPSLRHFAAKATPLHFSSLLATLAYFAFFFISLRFAAIPFSFFHFSLLLFSLIFIFHFAFAAADDFRQRCRYADASFIFITSAIALR
jgi:hypothetical protein